MSPPAAALAVLAIAAALVVIITRVDRAMRKRRLTVKDGGPIAAAREAADA